MAQERKPIVQNPEEKTLKNDINALKELVYAIQKEYPELVKNNAGLLQDIFKNLKEAKLEDVIKKQEKFIILQQVLNQLQPKSTIEVKSTLPDLADMARDLGDYLVQDDDIDYQLEFLNEELDKLRKFSELKQEINELKEQLSKDPQDKGNIAEAKLQKEAELKEKENKIRALVAAVYVHVRKLNRNKVKNQKDLQGFGEALVELLDHVKDQSEFSKDAVEYLDELIKMVNSLERRKQKPWENEKFAKALVDFKELAKKKEDFFKKHADVLKLIPDEPSKVLLLNLRTQQVLIGFYNMVEELDAEPLVSMPNSPPKMQLWKDANLLLRRILIKINRLGMHEVDVRRQRLSQEVFDAKIFETGPLENIENLFNHYAKEVRENKAKFTPEFKKDLQAIYVAMLAVVKYALKTDKSGWLDERLAVVLSNADRSLEWKLYDEFQKILKPKILHAVAGNKYGFEVGDPYIPPEALPELSRNIAEAVLNFAKNNEKYSIINEYYKNFLKTTNGKYLKYKKALADSGGVVSSRDPSVVRMLSELSVLESKPDFTPQAKTAKVYEEPPIKLLMMFLSDEQYNNLLRDLAFDGNKHRTGKKPTA